MGRRNEITLSIYKISKQQFTQYQKSMTIGKWWWSRQPKQRGKS